MKLIPALCLFFSAFISCNSASSPASATAAAPDCTTDFSTAKKSTRFALYNSNLVAYTEEERQRLPPFKYDTHYMPALQSKQFDMFEYNIKAKRDYYYHISLYKDAEKIWLECLNPPSLEDMHGGRFWGDLYYVAYKVVFADSTSFFSMHPIGQPDGGTPIYMLVEGGIQSLDALITAGNYDRTVAPSKYNLQAPQGLCQKMLASPIVRIDVCHYETAEERIAHKEGTEVLKAPLNISAENALQLQQYLNCVKDMPVPKS